MKEPLNALQLQRGGTVRSSKALFIFNLHGYSGPRKWHKWGVFCGIDPMIIYSCISIEVRCV